MERQEYKITRDGFDTFYFEHSMKTAYHHAIPQYEKCINDGLVEDSIKLFRLNTSCFGDKWLMIKEWKAD